VISLRRTPVLLATLVPALALSATLHGASHATGTTVGTTVGTGASSAATARDAGVMTARPLAGRSGSTSGTNARAKAKASPFTLAVIPDTQQEVLAPGDTRMRDRSRWLAKQSRARDLKYVMHTGDLVNWGWLDPQQYAVASAAMKPLERRGIPYAIAPGNHDTRAVGWNGAGGYGGDAYVKNPECLQRLGAQECSTTRLVRRTDELNAAFPTERLGRVTGAFEPGKIDNVYSTFRGGGLRWLVLTLELWPRTEAVEWARQVVASHPRHNVVVSTHSYLDAANQISASAEYGTNSPRYLFDQLISAFPNIKMVFSGHTGVAGYREDRGVAGNKIASFLGTFHSPSSNPVRVVRIDPRRNQVTSRFTAPATGERLAQYDVKVRGLDFVD